MSIQKSDIRDLEQLFPGTINSLAPPGDEKYDAVAIRKEVHVDSVFTGFGIHKDTSMVFTKKDIEGDWKAGKKISRKLYDKILSDFKRFDHLDIGWVRCLEVIGGSHYTVSTRIDDKTHTWVISNPKKCGSPYEEIGVLLEDSIRISKKRWLLF